MKRALSRALLIAITLGVVVLYYAPAGHVDFLENWGEGTYGTEFDAGNPVVTAIDPGSPAQRAGVRPGDRLANFRYGTQWGRINAPYAGRSERFDFQRGGRTFSVTLRAEPVPGFGLAQRIGGVLALLPPTIFLIVAFLLVFLRPSVMTWSFYFFAIGYFGTGPVFEYWSHVAPDWFYLAMSFVLTVVFGSWSAMLLLPFVLRFPNGGLGGWRNKIDRFVWLLLAVSLGAYVYEWFFSLRNGGLPPWSAFTDDWLPLFAFAFAALIVVKNYTVSSPDHKQRASFLVIGTIASFAAYAVYFVPGLPFAVKIVVGFAVVLMPVCVGYAVFALRVLDVSFVLGRATTYGLLSVGIIAFVSLLDWLFSQVLAIGRLAIGIELLATIAIGFLLDRINRGIGRLVDTVFFSGRRRAESYLRRAAKALPYATDEEAISEGLVQVPVDALDLVAAALYRRGEGERFEGLATSSQTPVAPPGFGANHLLARMLLSGESPVWLDELRSSLEPENAAIYVLAVPVLVRHELVAFTLYGAHRNGAQLDPEEVELLEELAREASRAYDHVEAVRVRERYARFLTASPETA
ncbi:MAG TPA: hypothetical protein VMH02_00120 [Verrucomicrobiae bacterium]|nr:hypothetical protein [Verrucomicrobiae bacterium]